MPSLDSDLNTQSSMFSGLQTQTPESRERAWKLFDARYAPIIRGFARKLACPSAHVDDLVQDVITGFYSASPNYIYDPSKGRFRGYLKTCVSRAIKKFRRKFPAAQNIDQLDPESPTAEKVWNRLWEAELLQAALREVRSHCTEANYRAFDLHVLQKKPVADVSKQLGISAENIYQIKARMKVKLEELLTRLQEEYG
jgi:RNA polymerase sigma-70 factor (ECF subfamily)